MKVSKHILEELEFSPDYCDRKYGDEKLGPGTYVRFNDHHNCEGFVFKAETFEQFAEACRCIVLMRSNFRWYPNTMEKIPDEPYTKGEIDATPEKLQSFVRHEIRQWKNECHAARLNNDFVEMCQVACSDHRCAGYAAILIVERRDEHEDEDWAFSKLLDPYKYFAKIESGLKKKKKAA